jgi:hypothetical protein
MWHKVSRSEDQTRSTTLKRERREGKRKYTMNAADARAKEI